ncbi:MAG: hypothetical protein IJU76_06360 [Desulfovibrionaceae bacterium]|nr:hypothetical protein [Desulfovibrionaceae bacterium]
MPLDVQGYSTQFNNFVAFANQEIGSGGGKKSVATLDGIRALGEHTIKASSQDHVGYFRRSQEMKDVNNEIRTIFKNAIAEMFGGEKNIPKSVKDAMQLSDYDKGKPLTARRILAVKQAIDTDSVAKLRVFKSADSATVALGKGWNKAELPNLARAAHFLSQATGVDEFEAIEQLSTPGSKANRLMNYGGRFMESAENFANGLRLIDSFADWHKDICTTMKPVYSTSFTANYDFTPADTFTKLNISGKFVNEEYLKGLEKFAFEELSVNPKANLAETDMEKLFGFKNNQAMNFMGHGFGISTYSTIENIPKERRAVIYAALNAFTQPANSPEEAYNKKLSTETMTWLDTTFTPEIIARVVKNFDRACELYDSGKLTAKNIINEFFSEIPDKGDYNYKTLNTYFNDLTMQLALDVDEGGQYTDIGSAVPLAMQNFGCTFDEAVQALRKHQTLSIPKYLTTGTVPIEKMNGTTEGGRKLIHADLDRPNIGYAFRNDLNTPLMKTGEGFGFTFPGEEKFYTNGSKQGVKNIDRVGDKVIAMCGPVHAKQANAVMMMLSQSGLSNLRAGINQINCKSDEHSAVDYTLTKNEETGSVTIKYSSPEALPFSFEWSATVDVNGVVTETPMTVERKSLDPQVVTESLKKAETRMQVELTDAQRAKASKFIGELGRAYDLKDKKLDLFANFVVSLNLTEKSSTGDMKRAIDMAKNISKWTEFQVGEGEKAGVGKLEETIKGLFNEIIDDSVTDAAKGAQSHEYKQDPDIARSMTVDAHRINFVFNGQKMPLSNDAVVSTFKDMFPNSAMRQGISSFLNQTSILMFTSLSMQGALPKTSVHPNLVSGTIPGCEKMVSRDMNAGGYMAGTLNEGSFEIHVDIKKDNTATLTFESNNGLTTGAGANPLTNYGKVSYTCTLQVDLSGKKPVITDAKLGQSFDIQ